MALDFGAEGGGFGICDVRLTAAQQLAEKHNAKAFDDLDAALGEDIDFAVICTIYESSETGKIIYL